MVLIDVKCFGKICCISMQTTKEAGMEAHTSQAGNKGGVAVSLQSVSTLLIIED